MKDIEELKAKYLSNNMTLGWVVYFHLFYVSHDCPINFLKLVQFVYFKIALV